MFFLFFLLDFGCHYMVLDVFFLFYGGSKKHGFPQVEEWCDLNALDKKNRMGDLWAGDVPWHCLVLRTAPNYIYIYSIYICVYMYIYICIYVSMYICIYVDMYICIYVYSIYVYMYICIYVYMYIRIYVYMYICIYVYMYICIYVYMYICICIYI